jgi:hypothetical protein
MSLNRTPLQPIIHVPILPSGPGVAGYHKMQSGMSASSSCRPAKSVVEDSQETRLNTPLEEVDREDFIHSDSPQADSLEVASVPDTFDER